MEIYILDKLLRPIDVVDEFISVIWTERFDVKGDFELVTLSTFANRKRFVEYAILSCTESDRLMIVDKVEETTDADEGNVLKIKGFDAISILEARMALGYYPLEPEEEQWTSVWQFQYPPADLMRVMFNEICRNGRISENDIIPFLAEPEESLYPESTIPEMTENIDWIQKPDKLYNAITDVGKIYDLGIRLYKDPNLSKLYFEVYAGSDRTTAQTTLPPVIFSPDMGNLQNTTEFSDVSQEFNVVQVFFTYKDEFENDRALSFEVTPDGSDPWLGGFDRKVKLLVVTQLPEDIDSELEIEGYLMQLGKEELQKSRPVGVFDGEANKNDGYTYGVDYFLGDLVEVRSSTGGTGYMRVVEQIFVQDQEGERSFPTLITKEFVNPGTWAAWKYDVEWSAMGSEEYWANQ
jgi:hypothetical protein